MPPSALRSNHRMPSPRCTGDRASWYGSVEPNGLGRVPATAADRNRFAHGPVGRRRPGTALGRRKSTGRRPRCLADEVDGSVELVGHLHRGQPVEQPVAVGVGADVDQPGGAGVGQAGPRHGVAVVGEVDAVVDERRGGVEGDGEPVALDDR